MAFFWIIYDIQIVSSINSIFSDCREMNKEAILIGVVCPYEKGPYERHLGILRGSGRAALKYESFLGFTPHLKEKFISTNPLGL